MAKSECGQTSADSRHIFDEKSPSKHLAELQRDIGVGLCFLKVISKGNSPKHQSMSPVTDLEKNNIWFTNLLSVACSTPPSQDPCFQVMVNSLQDDEIQDHGYEDSSSLEEKNVLYVTVEDMNRTPLLC